MITYFIIEIQKLPSGFAHIVHVAQDEDPTQARFKAESTYYTVLAAAALSSLERHAASLLESSGRCVMYQSYYHEPVAGGETA